MIDEIVLVCVVEAFIMWLLEMSDCLSFPVVTSVIFFFGMILAWKYYRIHKDD